MGNDETNASKPSPKPVEERKEPEPITKRPGGGPARRLVEEREEPEPITKVQRQEPWPDPPKPKADKEQ